MDALSGPRDFTVFVTDIGVAEDGRADCGVVVSASPATTSAVFTRSRFAGPSVELSRESASSDTRGVVVVSRNANVATGAQGVADAAEVRELVGRAVGCSAGELLIGSTGVIGRRYPMDVVRTRLREFAEAPRAASWEEFAAAIMTTDTRPKVVRRQVGQAVLVGVAKGVGMMEPDMATLLAFFFTDARVDQAELDRMFRGVVDTTFNALTIDTDTSTSDTAAVFANGAAGVTSTAELGSALESAALELVRMITSDGEGATRPFEVVTTGAADVAQAKRVGKTVANSPLVKTMVHGADPNWGRIAMAIGKCQDDTAINPSTVRIGICGVPLYPEVVEPETLERVREAMRTEPVHITVDLGLGSAQFRVFGCDLSKGYVEVNSSYTS